MSNSAEIGQASNNSNTPDINSTPNNNNDKENDQDSADVIIIKKEKNTKEGKIASDYTKSRLQDKNVYVQKDVSGTDRYR